MATMRFHLDEHVPHAIAEGLRRRGIDVTTTVDAGLRGAVDDVHLAYAVEQRRVIVTNDPDFLVLAQQDLPHMGIAIATRADAPSVRSSVGSCCCGSGIPQKRCATASCFSRCLAVPTFSLGAYTRVAPTVSHPAGATGPRSSWPESAPRAIPQRSLQWAIW